MKHISLFMVAIFITMLLLGCEYSTPNETIKDSKIPKETIETTIETVYIDDLEVMLFTGIYDSKNWNEEMGTYDQCVIPDAETAVSVASAIFSSMPAHERKYVPSSVFYDVPDRIWIVTFSRKNESEEGMWVGDCCSIALQEDDGTVLRIWAGE